MKPKLGDTIEFAMWADGRETPEMLAQFRKDVETAVAQCAARNSLRIAPPRLLEKRVGEERCPPVPKHIQGPNVRLIVAEADVVGSLQIRLNSFLSELEPKDLERLRRITRKKCYGLKPDGTRRRLTDEEVDRVIEESGPEAAAAAIRRGMASGLVH